MFVLLFPLAFALFTLSVFTTVMCDGAVELPVTALCMLGLPTAVVAVSSGLPSCPITFLSLKDAMPIIQKTYVDVSGVYMFILPNGSIYIGSSVDLARRMEEYLMITNGSRSPQTYFERLLVGSNPNEISLVFLCFCPPIISLVEEQLAMFLFYPSMNRQLIARAPIKAAHLSHAVAAIALARLYASFFSVDSPEYKAFMGLIQYIENALARETHGGTLPPSAIIGKPVFVYNAITGLLVLVYNSINAMQNHMKVSGPTITRRAIDHLIHAGQYVFSFVPLTPEYVLKCLPYVPHAQNVQLMIQLVDASGVVQETYESMREMCQAYGTYMRKISTAIALGKTWNGLTIVVTPKTQSMPVNCYDAATQQLIKQYPSVNSVIKEVGPNNYGVVIRAIKSNQPINGRVYAYAGVTPKFGK